MNELKMKKYLVLCLMLFLGIHVVKAQTYPEKTTDVSPMLVGEVVEDVNLYNADHQPVSLYSMLEKPTVLVFYRGLWCSNCVKHFAQEFKDHLQDIENQGYNLMLISADQGETLKKMSEQTGVPVAYFYGDKNNEFGKQMGLVWKQQERLKERLMESSENTNVDQLLPISAFYIINPQHEIRFADLRPTAIPVAKRILYKEFMPILKHWKE